MKFLGEYSSEVASSYKEKLKGEEIFPTAEDVGGYSGASWVTMGELKPRVRLFVEDNDYEKAVGLIKDLERNFEMQVKVDGKAADQVMIKIAIGFICFMAIAFIGHSRGWW